MATAQNARVTSLGLEKILPKVVDTVNSSNWILRRTMSAPKAWNGRHIQQPITTANSSLGTSFKCTETFSTSVDFAPVDMTWYSTGYAHPVTISMVERGINQTPLGQVALQKASFEFSQNSMADSLGTIAYGAGSGNDFDGLQVIVDDGATAANYAGLSRTTYGSQLDCGGSTGIVAATGGVLDLATMDSADDAASVSGLMSETPNVCLTTRAAWSLYGSLLEPQKVASYNAFGGSGSNRGDAAVGAQVQASNAANLNGGALGLTYRGKPVVPDNKCTTGVMFFLNEPAGLEFHSLSIPGLSTVRVANQVTEGVYDQVPPTAFQWRDWKSPVNQLAEIGIFVVYGQLLHRNPKRNEKITGITGT